MKPLTKEEERVLLVVYELAGGRDGVQVMRDDIERRCNELDLYNMTDKQYENYKQEVREKIRLRKQRGNGDLS